MANPGSSTPSFQMTKKGRTYSGLRNFGPSLPPGHHTKMTTRDELPILEPSKKLPIKEPSQNMATTENVLNQFNVRSEVAVHEEEDMINLGIINNDDIEYLKASLCGTPEEQQRMLKCIAKYENAIKKLKSEMVAYNQNRETNSSSQHGASLKMNTKKNAENQSSGVVKENPIQLVQLEASNNSNTNKNNNEIRNEGDSEDLLEDALAIVCRRKRKLCSQICTREDALVLHEECTERLSDGDIVLAQSIKSGNYDFLSENEINTRISSPDIFLPGQSSCVDLECACAMNNWRLPRYFVEHSDGKFLSEVVVKSKSFKLSLKGGLENSPREARECVASQMMAKLRERSMSSDQS